MKISTVHRTQIHTTMYQCCTHWLSCLNSTEKYPSWKANSYSASQWIPSILWNPEIFKTAFTTAHHLSLFRPRSIHSTPPYYLLQIRFNIITSSAFISSKWYFPPRVSPPNPVRTSRLHSATWPALLTVLYLPDTNLHIPQPILRQWPTQTLTKMEQLNQYSI